MQGREQQAGSEAGWTRPRGRCGLLPIPAQHPEGGAASTVTRPRAGRLSGSRDSDALPEWRQLVGGPGLGAGGLWGPHGPHPPGQPQLSWEDGRPMLPPPELPADAALPGRGGGARRRGVSKDL